MGILRSIFSPFARLLAFPARLFAGRGRLLGLSLPTRVTLALALFFVVCVVAYCVNVIWIRGQGFAGLRTALEGGYVLPLVILMALLLAAAYWTTRFWIEVEPGDFPDIDAAWEAGVAALAKAGIDIDATPLFLVVGVRDAQAAETLMDGSGWELVVSGQPEGGSPLRWYASRDAALLFALDASALSLCHDPRSARAAAGAEPTSDGTRQTLVSGGGEGGYGDAFGGRPGGGAAGIRGTIAAEEMHTELAPQAAPQPVSITGTLVSMGESLMPPVAAAQSFGVVDRGELAAQAERLGRICQLAKQARQPFCTINGVLAVVGWKPLSAEGPSSLPAALREDARMIVEAAGIHAPLIVMVSGMEGESGFMELVRRVGESRAQGNRFGHGFNHQAVPTEQLMRALASNSSAAFEGWVYDLFRQPECLRMGNNDKLFAMLCRIRSVVQPRLTDLLAGFAESVTPDRRRSLLLGGCYFAATGHGRARQAFLRSVLAKLIDMQDELEWTEESWRAENRYRRLIQTLLFLNGLLVVFIIGVFIWKYVSA